MLDIPKSFNPHEVHIDMVDKWMAQREKPYTCRVNAMVYSEDSDEIPDFKDYYVCLSQKELDCILRHGCEQRLSPTEAFYDKFWEEPDGDEAEELLERIKRELSDNDVPPDEITFDQIDAGHAVKRYEFFVLSFEDYETPHAIQEARPIYPYLSDEDYRELMIRVLDNRQLTIDYVARYYPEIYARLYDQVLYDEELQADVNGNFILVFGELYEDAFQLAGPLPFQGTIMENNSGVQSAKIVLSISDKKAAITSTLYPAYADGWGDMEVYFDIPVDDLLKALNVSTNEDALSALIELYQPETGLSGIVEWLNDHGIEWDHYTTDQYVPGY